MMIKSEQDKITPSIWDEFTKKYKVTKTLRFELIPQGQTQEHIKKKNIIQSQWVGGKNITTGDDHEKAENYLIVKKLMNEMHSLFIDEALAYDNIKNIFSSQDLENLNEHWFKASQSKEKKDIESFEKSKTTLVKKLKEVFDAVGHKWKKIAIDDFPNHPENESKKMAKIDKSGGDIMYASTGAPFAILIWLVQNGRIHVSKESGVEYSKEELFEIIHTFDGFHTYFTGFNENRANVYDVKGDNDQLLSTSIAHRIFEKNLEFFFQNMQKWAIFQKSISIAENKKILKDKNWDINAKLHQLENNLRARQLEISVNSISKPEAFLYFFSQNGIDAYNQLLGGLPAETEKEKVQGINEIINLTRQQLQAEKRNFPVLDTMYKQILSKSDKNFIDAFKDDKEMLTAIDFFKTESLAKKEREKIILPKTEKRTLYEHIIFEFVNELNEMEQKTELKKEYFLSFESIHKISTDITGTYDTIQNWWFANIDQQITDKIIIKTKANDLKKQKHLSFNDIESLIHNAMIQDSTNVKEPWRNGFSLKKYVTEKLETFISKNHVYTTVKDGKETELTILCILEAAKKENLLNALLKKAISNKEKDKEAIKEYLDANMDLYHFLKSFIVKQKDLTKEQEELFTGSSEFQVELKHILDQFELIDLYNKTRNFLSKKPYSTDKIKLNFENSTLGDGWDVNKETANTCVLFKKNNLYYLGVMDQEENHLFDYYLDFDDLLDINSKSSVMKKELQKKIFANSNDEYLEKVIYKQISSINQNLPRIIFSDSRINYFNPSKKILIIRDHATHAKNGTPQEGFEKKDFNLNDCHALIDFFKESIEKHPEWSRFGFTYSETKTYNDISEFYREVEAQGYSIQFDKIKEDYIKRLVDEGKLYLFQIYNKDFSAHSKGKDNLHTSYFKMLFDDNNLNDVVAKLNGQVELFYRPATIAKNDRIIHEKNKPILNKNPNAKNKKTTFEYDIIKDRRFTENKYQFHVPITLNFKQGSNSYLNKEIESFLANHPDVNIIGIDRGEKHLLYYSLINQKGEILEQGSLNTIQSTYMSDGEKVEHSTPYLEILDAKERERTEARKSWQTIENIKELKDGYLSQVVHKLATLIIKKNAIVVLEDLNFGFKRGRIKVEKQVYQKFEKTLIDKLNYLVFKDREFYQSGHYLNAFQLTSKFESFQKLGKQSGILFYTAASYTSKVDPVTGYMQNVYHQYEQAKTREFFRNFDLIQYNGEYVEFTFDLKKIQNEPEEGYPVKTKWMVGSCVQRSEYKPKSKTHALFHVNDRLIELFNDAKIDIKQNENLLNIILEQNDPFIKNLLYYFNAILKMRVVDSTEQKGSHDNDKIISPVSPFYDSSKVELPKGEEQSAKLPPNGDANGAFNIARKGVIILDKIGLRKDLEFIFKTVFKDEEYRPVWNKLKNPIEQVNDPDLFLPVFEKWAMVTGHDTSFINQFFKGKKLDDKYEYVAKFLNFVSGLSVSKIDWQNYSQRPDVVQAQTNKLHN